MATNDAIPNTVIEHLELFTLIWLYSSADIQDDRNVQQRLRTIINHVERFTDVETCQKYIEKLSKDDRLVLIVSDCYAQPIVSSIHHLRQVSSIYVYRVNQEQNEPWIR